MLQWKYLTQGLKWSPGGGQYYWAKRHHMRAIWQSKQQLLWSFSRPFVAGCLYSQQSPNKQQERTHNSELGLSLYWVQQCSVGANSSDLISNWMVAVKGEWNASPLAWYLNSLLFGLSNAIAKAKTWVCSWRRVWYQCRVGHEWLCPKWSSCLEL